jgi:hypothetical protein
VIEFSISKREDRREGVLLFFNELPFRKTILDIDRLPRLGVDLICGTGWLGWRRPGFLFKKDSDAVAFKLG